MAPTLFNIFFSAVVSSWRSSCGVAGIEALYKLERKLVGDRTAKAKLDKVKVTESQFADDVALYATSRASFETVAKSIVHESKRWGMTVSLTKTKGMVLGQSVSEGDTEPVSVEGGEIEVVESFSYLGSVLSCDGEVMDDIKCRIAKASRAFGCLRRAILITRHSRLRQKDRYMYVLFWQCCCMALRLGS